MIYKNYEIVAEAITGRAEYSLDDNGELKEYMYDVDCDPEPLCYGIVYKGDTIDWADTIDEVKKYIDIIIKYKGKK